MKKQLTRGGFTLIELSIVLVIIGLLVGGVLVGRDLIKAAQIRSIASQVEQYQAASNTFKLKYNCLAGDCPTATAYFSGTANGNNNGRIGQFWSSVESILFWQHLALAGMIPGSFTTVASGGAYAPDVNFPSTKMGGALGASNFGDCNAGGNCLGSGWFFPANYGNVILFGRPWGDTSSNMPLRGIISGIDAQLIDSKFDDGRPAYGRIITWQNQSGYSGGCSSTNVASTAQYVNTTTPVCSLFFVSLF